MAKKTLILAFLLLCAQFPALLLTRISANSQTKSSDPKTAFAISAGTLLVPDDYARIQWAISNASEGDTVTVRAGTYFGNLIVNKSISVVGEGPDKTVIDGQGTATVIYVTAPRVSIIGFTIQNCSIGIWFHKADNGTARQNVVKNNSYGIKIDESRNMVLTENTVEDSKWFGIVLNKSGNSTLRNNRLSGTRYNLQVNGFSPDDYLNDIDTTNTINDKPVHYLKNKHNILIDSSTLPDIGYLAIINSTNVTVSDMNVMYNGQGILLAFTNNSIIKKVTATGNWNGIEVQHSSNVTVSESKTNNNGDFGIKFERSANGLIVEDEANNNGWAGVGVFTSSGFSVTKCTTNNNIYGIDLVYSKGNLVTLNSASNTVDKYSIAVYYSNSNIIYHNNFMNYLIFKDKDKLYVPNTWDNSNEGNYWTTYSGQDTDQDGIGDTPYSLEEGNGDNYPLMGMFSIFQATPEFNITIISNSNISNFQFDQQNKRISFDAIGESGTHGFGRLRLPKSSIGDSYRILVNDQEPATQRQLPISNETYLFLYVTYLNSTSPDGGVPAVFWWFLIFSMIFIFILISVFFIKKKIKTRNNEF